jgi:tryptophan halogenase
MEIPATLAEKIDLFSNKGRIFRRDGDLFTEESWLAVMLGQGIVPRSYDYLVNKYPVADLARQLGRLRAGMAATAAALPRHSEFLARIARDETQMGKFG